MRVTVKYRGPLVTLANKAAEEIESETVKDVIRHIKMNYGGKTEKLAKAMIIAVNGENILQKMHFKTPLQDGDEISFLPICGGG